MIDTAIKQKVVVCAYCRVSTNELDQINSFENQNNYYLELAKNSSNYTLYKVYADQGLSATSWKRREDFQNMLYDAGLDIDYFKKELRVSLSDRIPKFERILVKDVSRFARNQNTIEIIRKLKEKKVYIDFTTINLSTETTTDDIMLSILMILAEHDSKDKSTKVLFGQKEGAKRGVIKTANNFFGYNYIKEDNSLEIIEAEAVVVRKIYELYNNGLGLRRILNYLENENILTRKGKPFVQQSIKRILENPAYKGTLVRNKMDSPLVLTMKTYATLKPEAEWIITENRIPIIVDPIIWEKAQQIKKGKINHLSMVGIYTGISEYAGKISCGLCGSSYVKNHEKKTGRSFYNCSLKKKKGVKMCPSPNVDIKELDKLIDFLCNEGLHTSLIKDKGKEIEKYVEKIGQLKASLNKQSISDVELLKKELNELYEEKKRIAFLFIKKTLAETELEIMQEEIDLQIQNLVAEIAKKSETSEQIYEKIKILEELINNLNALNIKSSYEREEVFEQLESIVIRKSLQNNNLVTELSVKLKYFDDINKVVAN